MTDSPFTEKLVSYLESDFGVDRKMIEETTPLFSEGYLDSFSMVELVKWIEENSAARFGVLDITLDHLDTIQRIQAFVANRTG